MDSETARALRELSSADFQDLILYASDRCWAIVEVYSRTMRDVPENLVASFVGAFEGELFSATTLVGLAGLYHSSANKPPPILQKLINIHSFGQLRDPYSIAELVAAERGRVRALPRGEGGWWWQYDGPLNKIVATPPISIREILKGWSGQPRDRVARLKLEPSHTDSLRLLHLSHDDLHLAFNTSEKLRQEAAMESITTLKFITDIERSIEKLDAVLSAFDLFESSEGAELPASTNRRR